MQLIELRYTGTIPEGVEISLPLSKSISNRFLILHYLFNNIKPEFKISESRDTQLLAKALAENPDPAWFQDGATPYRFYLAYAAATGIACTLDADTSLMKRSVAPLVNALEELGGSFDWTGQQGFPPVRTKGSLKPASEVTIDRSISSQYVSAIMLIAPLLSSTFTIKLTGTPNSDSYIRLTASCMEKFGITCDVQKSHIVISSGQANAPKSIRVEPDWSSAAWFFMLCSAMPGSSFRLIGLTTATAQEDSTAAGIFLKLGVSAVQQNDGLFIFNNAQVSNNFSYDFTENIDLAPAVICACAFKRIAASFTGLNNLRFKESDRIRVIQSNLQKFGIHLIENNEGWALSFTEPPEAHAEILIETHNDHRMAMAFSVFALRNKIIFDNAECVEKSFPDYWQQMTNCNFAINHVA